MDSERDGTRLEALSKARNGSRCSLNECRCTNAATARPGVSLSTGMEVQESFSAYCGDRAAINSPSGWNRFDEGDSSPRISAPSPHQGESSQPKNFILAARSSLVTARRMRAYTYRRATQHSLKVPANRSAHRGVLSALAISRQLLVRSPTEKKRISLLKYT